MNRMLVACVTFFLCCVAALADASGKYAVKGTSPDGEQYAGEVTIIKTGDVYELMYRFEDGTEQEGSAIGNDNFLAYGYGDDEETGVGMMNAKEGNWEGIWTNVGSSKMGIETWMRK